MKAKLLIYLLPLAFLCFSIYGFVNQDDPKNDSYMGVQSDQVTLDGKHSSRPIINQSDTTPPAGFPYPRVFNWNYSTIPNVNGGTVGAIRFNNKFYLNRWNLVAPVNATNYRYNADGPGGGPGTRADSNTAYNAGTGSIRDLTIAPDGSGQNYLWGGSAGTVLYKMDSLLNRVASYTHTGASYRAIAWDPNRKGFWSSNFAGNIVCRDTAGVVKGTVVNSLAAKYGLGFDSSSVADSAFLWVWEQGPGTTSNTLHKFNLATGSEVSTYTFTLSGTSVGIAGGAEVQVIGTKVYLFLNFQNQAVVGYDLKPGSSLSVTARFEGPFISATNFNDPVTIQLRNSTSPFAIVDSDTKVLSPSGTATFNFGLAQPGSYYVVVRSRFGIETWSANPIAFPTTTSYDFTTGVGQAFGNNMRLISGTSTIYVGDVNQDGVIDGTDGAAVDNDVFNFAPGFGNTDLNWDGVVDGSDATYTDNNAANFVAVNRPL